MTTRTLGNYTLEGLLGEGGIGRVYAAHDEVLGRRVAIKMLRPELSRDRALVDRFYLEAKNLGNLNHSNITTLFSLHVEGDEAFMVMELVQGETLETLLERSGRLTLRESLAILAQAIPGIRYAHRRGVIHRDLKPANLMITEDGGIKIMDFGIARVRGSEHLTQVGEFCGTFRYASPEQIRGEEVDERSDLYSLAIVFYRMVAGSPPFTTANQFELMTAQLETPPPPLTGRVGDLDAETEQALMRSLAKRPEERFASVDEFGRAIGAGALRGESADILQQLFARVFDDGGVDPDTTRVVPIRQSFSGSGARSPSRPPPAAMDTTPPPSRAAGSHHASATDPDSPSGSLFPTGLPIVVPPQAAVAPPASALPVIASPGPAVVPRRAAAGETRRRHFGAAGMLALPIVLGAAYILFGTHIVPLPGYQQRSPASEVAATNPSPSATSGATGQDAAEITKRTPPTAASGALADGPASRPEPPPSRPGNIADVDAPPTSPGVVKTERPSPGTPETAKEEPSPAAPAALQIGKTEPSPLPAIAKNEAAPAPTGGAEPEKTEPPLAEVGKPQPPPALPAAAEAAKPELPPAPSEKTSPGLAPVSRPVEVGGASSGPSPSQAMPVSPPTVTNNTPSPAEAPVAVAKNEASLPAEPPPTLGPHAPVASPQPEGEPDLQGKVTGAKRLDEIEVAAHWIKIYGIIDNARGGEEAKHVDALVRYLQPSQNHLVCYHKAGNTYRCYSDGRDIARLALHDGIVRLAPNAPAEYRASSAQAR